jgi:hypothetical protein
MITHHDCELVTAPYRANNVSDCNTLFSRCKLDLSVTVNGCELVIYVLCILTNCHIVLKHCCSHCVLQVLVAQSKLAEAAAAIQDTSDIAGTPAAVATVAALYKAAGNDAAAVSTLQSALKVTAIYTATITALVCIGLVSFNAQLSACTCCVRKYSG